MLPEKIQTHDELEAFAASERAQLEAALLAAGESLRSTEALHAPAFEALRSLAAEVNTAEGDLALDTFERKPLLQAIDTLGTLLSEREIKVRQRVRAAKDALVQFGDGIAEQRARIDREQEELLRAEQQQFNRFVEMLSRNGLEITKKKTPPRPAAPLGKPTLKVVGDADTATNDTEHAPADAETATTQTEET